MINCKPVAGVPTTCNLGFYRLILDKQHRAKIAYREGKMESNNIVMDLQNSALKMTGWLKFVGIVTIVSGALAALSVVGIVFAWIPIWLGILLMQAAARAENARISENPHELVQMFEKLRLYFLINGVMIILGLIFALLVILSIGTLMPILMENMDKLYL
jgi:hypothetical protein